jgi:uncharacterized protein (TIGR02453 family)
MMKFNGFPPKALSFFRQLQRNNSRDWFTPRKEQFQELICSPMIEAIERVNDELRKIAVEYVTAPKKALYRLYRDTRFSNDKTPYKTHQGATFHHQKFGKNNAAGLYFSISHKEVEVAGGMYMPGEEEWLAVRNAWVKDIRRFEKIVTDKKLLKVMGKPQGERLSRVPKAFDPDSPAKEYLPYKQFYFYTLLDADLATSPKLIKEVLLRFKLLLPVVNYLNEAALDARAKDAQAERPSRPDPMF